MSSEGDGTYVRELEEGEPTEPTSVVIMTREGRRIACLVTRKDQRTWVAEPPEPHQWREGDVILIDRLPAGGAVEFVNLIGPGGEGWSGRSASRHLPPGHVT